MSPDRGLLPPASPVAPAAPTSPAQSRIIVAALKLFARHGVGGTSLQMIADDIGVTKAAVYHQYNTKEEIVRAVAGAEIARLEAVLDRAEAERDPVLARDAALAGIVDLAVQRRRQVSNLLSDPVIGRLYIKDPRLLQALDRLNRLLMGSDAGPESRIATAMLTAAISGAVVHPFVMDEDDDTLSRQLRQLARRFVGLPD